MKETPELEPLTTDSRDYDRILFATPIWAGTFAPPLRTYIQQTSLENKKFAFTFCSSGGNIAKAFVQLKELLSAEGNIPLLSLIDPKSKPSEVNDKKVRSFCNLLQM